MGILGRRLSVIDVFRLSSLSSSLVGDRNEGEQRRKGRDDREDGENEEAGVGVDGNGSVFLRETKARPGLSGALEENTIKPDTTKQGTARQSTARQGSRRLPKSATSSSNMRTAKERLPGSRSSGMENENDNDNENDNENDNSSVMESTAAMTKPMAATARPKKVPVGPPQGKGEAPFKAAAAVTPRATSVSAPMRVRKSATLPSVEVPRGDPLAIRSKSPHHGGRQRMFGAGSVDAASPRISGASHGGKQRVLSSVDAAPCRAGMPRAESVGSRFPPRQNSSTSSTSSSGRGSRTSDACVTTRSSSSSSTSSRSRSISQGSRLILNETTSTCSTRSSSPRDLGLSAVPEDGDVAAMTPAEKGRWYVLVEEYRGLLEEAEAAMGELERKRGEEVKALEAKVMEVQAAMGELERRKEGEVEGMRERMEAEEANAERLRKEREVEMDDLRGKLEAVELALVQIRQSKEEEVEELRRIKEEEIEELKEKLKEVERASERASAEGVQQEVEIQRLRGELAAVERMNVALKMQVEEDASAAAAVIDGLRQEKSGLQGELVSCWKMISAKGEEHKKELDELRSAVEARNAEVREMRREEGEEVMRLRGELMFSEAKNEALAKQMAAAAAVASAQLAASAAEKRALQLRIAQIVEGGVPQGGPEEVRTKYANLRRQHEFMRAQTIPDGSGGSAAVELNDVMSEKLMLEERLAKATAELEEQRRERNAAVVQMNALRAAKESVEKRLRKELAAAEMKISYLTGEVAALEKNISLGDDMGMRSRSLA